MPVSFVGAILVFEFMRVRFVKISGINFTNCGEPDISHANSFAIENYKFFNHQSYCVQLLITTISQYVQSIKVSLWDQKGGILIQCSPQPKLKA